MRLSTQLILGHTGLIVAFIVLGALGIGIVERMTRSSEALLKEGLRLVEAAQALERSALLHEVARSAGDDAAGPEARVGHALSEALLAADSPEAKEVLAKLKAVETFNLSDPATSRLVLDAAAKLSALSLASVRVGAEHSSRMGRSGIGLIAVVAILGLGAALYFGYWLSKSVTHPMERLVRGLDHVVAGDLGRRLSDSGSSGAISELAAGINQLVDRLQRAETTPQVDLLTACAAVEKLCQEDPRACGVLASGHRLLASNDRARRLVLDRGSSFQWLASEMRKQSPAAVETASLEGPSGESLGDLVRIRTGEGEYGDADPQ